MIQNDVVMVKAHANGRNKCQQLPTLLGVVGQQCCGRLHDPKSLTGFKLYATSANKCQHCCSSMQTDAKESKKNKKAYMGFVRPQIEYGAAI